MTDTNSPPDRQASSRKRVSREWEAEARRLWENELAVTAEEIGRRFGVSRNTIVGLATRRAWDARRPRREIGSFSTMDERLAALHARLNAVMAATVGVGKISVAVHMERVKARAGMR